MKKKIISVTFVVLLILTLDQFLKLYIKSFFSPGETHALIGDWFLLEYIENQGMAFGTSFGTKPWHKLALSVFRIIAIIGLFYYWVKQLKKGSKLEFLIILGFVFAGATGNLIDSMFYDFIFEYDPCMVFNYLPGSGLETECGSYIIETRHSGFLFGNVVDMFKFHAYWPKWVPYLGEKEVFPAIWNIADASISIGVIAILIRQKTYFPKQKSNPA